MADGRGDEFLELFDDAAAAPGAAASPWPLLVADDDPAVHAVTRLVLRDVRFRDRPIEVIEAHSAAEAFDIMSRRPDIPVALVDVVMEKEDAGLRLVQRIRNELSNNLVRIILRTGQPGSAPERSVVLEYDINDYKEKQELTTDKLVTSVVTALRGHYALREVKKAYAELTQAQGRLAELEKLAALGGLVAGITHEVNTPIGTCVQAATHLQDVVGAARGKYEQETLTPSDFEEFLDEVAKVGTIIEAASQNAARLIGGFKTMAVDQASGARRPFKIAALIDDVLLALSPRLRKTQHRIEVDCPADEEIDSYPGALSQILTNLIMNSLVHGFDGIGRPGTMRIAVQPAGQPAGQQVMLTYSDDGRGIAAEHKLRVFEPFFTTKRGKGGSGIGLSMVYTLATETLGGTIAMESSEGSGVTFTLTLPRDAPGNR
ncbi:MAG: hybrid sensor histidine kinase/response regulator [Alphaproteobacteria bacterium]|nr:hybrid sensor histidine kinase/response regulator [Alphaproteobacteria bacterium]